MQCHHKAFVSFDMILNSQVKTFPSATSPEPQQEHTAYPPLVGDRLRVFPECSACGKQTTKAVFDLPFRQSGIALECTKEQDQCCSGRSGLILAILLCIAQGPFRNCNGLTD